MNHSPTRRSLLLALAAAPLAAAVEPLTTTLAMPASALAQLAALEQAHGGRLGLAALNTADGAQLLHRAEERFPFCSTFKMMVAAAILARSAKEPRLLKRRVRYAKSELVSYSPATEEHVKDGMTVAALCEATLQLSDNSAGNFLMKLLGGPAAVTAYARTLGDTEFRLDRWETELNSCIPGDPRDTTTPAAMMRTVNKLLLGEALPAPQRKQLSAWMVGNLTGDTRIRAGAPAGSTVADKTGTAGYGTTNDIGVIWPPGKAPIVLAIYLTHPEEGSKPRNDVLAAATKIVASSFA
ncbi:class A beta-lactamase [Oxalobacteraceae bacterium]|nr:class A beta-lactamase [Oxalobacteraceae bacterium]